MADLEWRHTKPINRLSFRESIALKDSFAPRIKPYNFFIHTDDQIHDMAPTEYLICYSNELTAIGVAKDLNKLGDRPLTMQFGTANERIGRDIYVGCIILVKSYAIKIGSCNQLTRITNLHSTHNDVFFNARLNSNTLATEWSIIHKPKVERALGRVTEFEVTNRKHGRVSYTGRVLDQENQVELEVHDDLWPNYIKRAVPIDSAVVISWVKIDGPHAYCSQIMTGKTLLPSGATRLYINGLKEATDVDYWPVCVDTNFKASRTF